MPKKEAPIDYLRRYIPDPAAGPILQLLNTYKVHLTITKERKTVLGDYRHPTSYKTHRISVNGNLNKYSFLITLIHELAHLLTYEEFGNQVASHGKEWKFVYAKLLAGFLSTEIFPLDVLASLKNSLHDLPASSCSDENLMRLLRKYDTNSNGMVLIESLPEGALFEVERKVFRKQHKLRKRFSCIELESGRTYLFSPIYEVKRVG